MPDFLHKDPERDGAQDAEKKPALAPDLQGDVRAAQTPSSGVAASVSARAENGGMDDARLRLLRRRATESSNASEEGHPSQIKKAPSRVWTDYYGAIFLLMVAVFIGLGTFVLRPLVIEYRRLSATISSNAVLLGDEHSYLQSVEGSIHAAQSIPPETLANVEEALPRDANIPKLLQMVALFSKKENIPLSSVQFTTPPADTAGNGEPIPIDINLNVSLSGYAGLRQFLDGVEHSLRVFDLGNVSVSAGSIGGNTGTSAETGYSFQIRTYFLPPPPPSTTH